MFFLILVIKYSYMLQYIYQFHLLPLFVGDCEGLLFELQRYKKITQMTIKHIKKQ